MNMFCTRNNTKIREASFIRVVQSPNPLISPFSISRSNPIHINNQWNSTYCRCRWPNISNWTRWLKEIPSMEKSRSNCFSSWCPYFFSQILLIYAFSVLLTWLNLCKSCISGGKSWITSWWKSRRTFRIYAKNKWKIHDKEVSMVCNMLTDNCFQIIWTLWRSSGHISNYPDTFQIIWTLSKSHPDTFQVIQTHSRL